MSIFNIVMLLMSPAVALSAQRRCAGCQGGQPEGDVPKQGMNFPPHNGLPAGALRRKGHVHRPIAPGEPILRRRVRRLERARDDDPP